ncbi:GTP-binding protein Rhes [Saguinus oedipus]|uniref:GTP-binding protein Rhes n=1 Tax=Saguinus oedipus TaxID=9490 RepID=A0ABQ9WJ26_SAGOE|nr:GTP-binding protein Rhes [Saguinus oedipus]
MKTLSSGNCTLSVPAKNSYRMVVLGASRVGKSSIVSRFLNGRFEDQYTPTIEDFHRKVYNIRGDMYQLDILDTSGNHPFPAMRRLSILTGEARCRAGVAGPGLGYGVCCALGSLHGTCIAIIPSSETGIILAQ